jgi:hypothetical protein
MSISLKLDRDEVMLYLSNYNDLIQEMTTLKKNLEKKFGKNVSLDTLLKCNSIDVRLTFLEEAKARLINAYRNEFPELISS